MKICQFINNLACIYLNFVICIREFKLIQNDPNIVRRVYMNGIGYSSMSDIINVLHIDAFPLVLILYCFPEGNRIK